MENEEGKAPEVPEVKAKEEEPKKVDPTTLATIEEWVNTLDIAANSRAEYVKLLNDQEITISLLSSLTEPDLLELGVAKIGPRKAMLKGIELLKAKDEKPTTTARKSSYQRQRKKDAPPPEPLPPPTVVINDLDRDLDLRVKLVNTDNSIHCWPHATNNFIHLWSGARANYGVQSGKYWFEFAITETDSRKVNKDDLMLGKTGCRVGWSTLDTQVDMAGDAAGSFCYDSEGKKANNKELSDYGDKFYLGDTLGCFLNLDQYTVSFSKNGKWHGVAFIIPEELRSKPFYPHMSCKNVRVKFNFGAQPAVTPVPQGYEFIEKAPKDKLVPGLLGSTERKDHEVIVPIGLPLAGKTEWVNKWVTEHPEKHYTVLGTDYIINRMKTWTLPNFSDEQLPRAKKERVERAVHRINGFTSSLFNAIVTQFIRKSPPRNYILDSTNLSDEGRRSKLDNFDDYGKIAVCFVVPGRLLESRGKAVKRSLAGVPLENLGATPSQKGRFDLPEEVDAKIVDLPALDLPEPIPPEEPKKEEEKVEKEEGKEEGKEEENKEKEDHPQTDESSSSNQNKEAEQDGKTKEEGTSNDTSSSSSEQPKQENNDVVMSTESSTQAKEDTSSESKAEEQSGEKPAESTESTTETVKEEEVVEEKKEVKPKKKLFDEIWFVGSNKEESIKILEEYKAEAKKYEDEHRSRRGDSRRGRGRGGRFRDSRGRGRGGGFRGSYGTSERRYSTPDRYGGRDRYEEKRYDRYDSDSSKRRYADNSGGGSAKRRRYDDYSPRSSAPVYSVPYSPSGYGSQYAPPPTYVYQYASPSPYKGGSGYSQAYSYRGSSQSSRQGGRSSGSNRRY